MNKNKLKCGNYLIKALWAMDEDPSILVIYTFYKILNGFQQIWKTFFFGLKAIRTLLCSLYFNEFFFPSILYFSETHFCALAMLYMPTLVWLSQTVSGCSYILEEHAMLAWCYRHMYPTKTCARFSWPCHDFDHSQILRPVWPVLLHILIEQGMLLCASLQLWMQCYTCHNSPPSCPTSKYVDTMRVNPHDRDTEVLCMLNTLHNLSCSIINTLSIFKMNLKTSQTI